MQVTGKVRDEDHSLVSLGFLHKHPAVGNRIFLALSKYVTGSELVKSVLSHASSGTRVPEKGKRESCARLKGK